MKPLAGKRVVDVTRLLPGGYCSMMLSDLGAEVIKVEEPGLGDYMRLTPPMKGEVSLVHEMVNKNKMSLGLNLKTKEGKRILRKLLRDCDVFIDGFRPGVIERLGFSFDAVRKINPRIVYCSISAFGHASPLSSIPGHDLNFQGLAGVLDPSEEQVPLVQFADLCSGLHAAVGILSVLCNPKRQATFIDVPIVQSLLSWLILPASHYFTTGRSPREEPSLAFGSDSYYNLYGTADKKLMAVAAIESEFWRNLMDKLGLDELASLKRGSRDERMRLKSRIAEVFSTKTRDQWSKVLMMSDTCATPVLALQEALDSDWAESSGVVRKNSSGKRVLGTPIRFSPHQKIIERPAPALGEQTRRILSRIGYSNEEIDSMIREGVVSVA